MQRLELITEDDIKSPEELDKHFNQVGCTWGDRTGDTTFCRWKGMRVTNSLRPERVISLLKQIDPDIPTRCNHGEGSTCYEGVAWNMSLQLFKKQQQTDGLVTPLFSTTAP